MLELPVDLVLGRQGPIRCRQCGRFRGVRGRPQGMGAHVSDGCGLRGSPGGRHRGRTVDLTCSTAGNKPPADLFGGIELTASEGTRSGDGVARASICRGLCLEYGHDPLSAVRGPRRDNATLGLA